MLLLLLFFLTPIILFEIYRIKKDVIKGSIVVWLILVPLLIEVAFESISISSSSNSAGSGWAVIALMTYVPLGLLVSSGWILFRIRSTTHVWNKPVLSIVILSIAALLGWYLFQGLSIHNVLVENGYEKKFFQSDNAFLDTCSGECFSNYLETNVFNKLYERSVVGGPYYNTEERSAILNDAINYCVRLPNKIVNAKILYDDNLASGTTYSQLCLSLLARHLQDVDGFLLGMEDFMNSYPQWKTRATKRSDGSYLIYGAEKGVYLTDVINYVYEKAYGSTSSTQ